MVVGKSGSEGLKKNENKGDVEHTLSQKTNNCLKTDGIVCILYIVFFSESAVALSM